MSAISYICDSEYSLDYCIANIKEDWSQHKYLIVKTRTGKDRTLDQNKRACRIYQLLAKYYNDQFPEFNEAKSHCKLYFGVNIMMEDEKFYTQIKTLERANMTIEEKLSIMLEPFDLPVTRLMNREQFSRYCGKIMTEFNKIDWDKHLGKKAL